MTVLMVCSLATAGTVFGAAPTVQFVSPGPGINAPMDTDERTETYGIKTSGWAWTFDGDSGRGTWSGTVGPFARYQTSLEGDTTSGTSPVTPMPEDEDWVLEIVYKHTGLAWGSETLWYSKHEIMGNQQPQTGREDRMLALSPDGSDNWTLKVGNASGGWDAVATGIQVGTDTWNTFTMHYKADVQKFDAYQNDVLLAGDFETGHGRYDLSFLQIESGRAEGGADWVQSVMLGQPVFGGPSACDPGDADADGDVDDDDLSLLLANWGSETATCAQGEFNDTAPIDDDDLSLLLANWTGPIIGAVPEPATMALLALCAPTLLQIRRKT